MLGLEGRGAVDQVAGGHPVRPDASQPAPDGAHSWLEGEAKGAGEGGGAQVAVVESDHLEEGAGYLQGRLGLAGSISQKACCKQIHKKEPI